MSEFFNGLPYYLWQTTLGMTAVTLVGLSAVQAQEQERFGNDGIRLDVDTMVEFEFVESNGSYQSVFGIVNLQTGEKFPLYSEVKDSDMPQSVYRPSNYQDDIGAQNRSDFYGSPGNTVPQPLGEFRFVANTDYSFYLESSFKDQPAGMLYSTSNLNTNNRDYARFDGPLDDILNGGLILRWEDTGSVLVGDSNTDYDYDDFVVRIGGHLSWDYGCLSEADIRPQVEDIRLQVESGELQPEDFCRPEDLRELGIFQN